MRRSLPAALVAAWLLSACASDPVGLTGTDSPLLSKGGGKGGGTTNPNATFTYHHPTDNQPAGIIGDGRAANGSASTDGNSVYDHGQCGVTSTIWADREGDATMDPVGASVSKRNCTTSAARSLTVLFDGILGGAEVTPAVGGHFTNVRAVLALTTGESGERLFTLLLRGGHTCERIRYDAQVTAFGYQGSAVRVTRTGEKEWLAESLPNSEGRHVAFCQVGGSGGVGDFYNPGSQLGAYHIPLRITIRQK